VVERVYSAVRTGCLYKAGHVSSLIGFSQKLCVALVSRCKLKTYIEVVREDITEKKCGVPEREKWELEIIP
jgi:hypothetical protein